MNLRLQPLTSGNSTATKAPAPSASDMVSRFHALMLQQAFKTMLQSTAAAAEKSNFARDVWRDQLAEKLAIAATQSGSLTGRSSSEG